MMEPNKSSNGKANIIFQAFKKCVPNVIFSHFNIKKRHLSYLSPQWEGPMKFPTCLRHSEKRHSLAMKSESLRKLTLKKPGGDQNKRTKSIRNTMKHGVFGVKSLCLVQGWWCFVWIRSFSQCFAVLMVWKQDNSPNYSSDCLASGKGYHFGKAHIRNCTTGNFCRVG